MKSTIATALLVCAALATASAADETCHQNLLADQLAHNDGRAFDAVLGRDARQYAPDALVDFQHLSLDLTMRDPTSQRFTCTETLTFDTLALPVAQLRLDAVGLKVDAVTDLAGRPLKFDCDDEHLTIAFAEAVAPRTPGGVVVRYACVKPQAGMIFVLPDAAHPERKAPQIHTQGEPEQNRNWFVSHDYPNDRMTSEIRVTIPSNLSALANGALVGKEQAGEGMTRWHYKLGRPHASYLVSLVIGEFDIVQDKWRDVPVEYWVPKGKEAAARRTLGKTPKMIELFSKLTGADYPYEKYAQSCVLNFAASGMENTSATTLLDEVLIDDEHAALDQDAEGLVSHELAHQWFGDMLTCKSWAHLWLNEGFATFMDRIWHESEAGKDEYDFSTWQAMRRAAESDDAGARGGGVSWTYYDSPSETFRRGASNPYGKGSCVLHMLRRSCGPGETGDAVFWQAISTYVKRNAWTSVESDDLRKAFDDVTGRNYEPFFQQWVYRAGSPSVAAEYKWDAAAGEATVTLKQTQAVSEASPAFFADVEVWFVSADGKIEKRVLKMDARTEALTARLDFEPAQVAIDPNGALLAKWDFDALPTAKLIATARAGPTMTARLAATAALSKKDREDVREALGAIASDEKTFYGLRGVAADALGRMQSPDARDALVAIVKAGVKDPKARAAIAGAVARYDAPAVAEVLVKLAADDESTAVQAAATEALGGQTSNADAVVDTLVKNCGKKSYKDSVRTSALAALGRLGDPRGIEPAKAAAAYGQPYRVRPAAIAALGDMARENESLRAKVRPVLVALLQDPEERSARSAAGALGTTGDPAAVAPLKAVIESSASDEVKRRAKQSIDAIAANEGESAAVKSLRDRVEALEKTAKEK